MNLNQVTIFGATGLIGNSLLNYLISDSSVKKINVITRSEIKNNNSKINSQIIDFKNIDSINNSVKNSKVVYVCIGTTMSAVKGNKNKYREIEYDIILKIANACKQENVNQFLLVSTLGANSNSNSFYLSLKGEIENDVSAIQIPSTSFFRPSILIGKRNEFRVGESIMKCIMTFFRLLIPEKYKPIQGSAVAQSMLNISKKNLLGVKIYCNRKIILNAK